MRVIEEYQQLALKEFGSLHEHGKGLEEAFFEAIDDFFTTFEVRNLHKFNFDYDSVIEDLCKRSKVDFNVLQCWTLATKASLETGKALDFWGSLYETYMQSGGKAKAYAQFFTPESVAELCSRVVQPDPSGSINDPTCGSGRLLLAHFTTADKKKFHYYVGEDLDEKSCKMCALNMMMNGMFGQVVKQNTLTQEVYWGVEINEGMYPFPGGLPTLRMMSADEVIASRAKRMERAAKRSAANEKNVEPQRSGKNLF